MQPRAIRAVAGLIALTFLFPALAAAQQTSLAEVARKEAERRKGLKETQKVITTKDLPESARKPAAAPAGGKWRRRRPVRAAAPAPGASPQAAAPAAGEQKDEKYWRTRMAGAQESLRRNEAFAEALQTRINALSLNLVNRDDRVQRAKVGDDRAKAMEELARVRSDIEQSKKQIADVEEDARKAGVPPGWLR